jgi:hypothetical protein
MPQDKFDKLDKVLMMVGAFVMILIFIHTCGTNGQLTIDYRKMKEEVESYKVQHLADSSQLISQAVNYQYEIDSRNMAIKLLAIRNPKEIVKIQYKTKIETKIQLAEPITIDSTSYIKLPVEFSDYSEWYSIDGKIDTLGVLVIDSIVSSGTLTYSVGDTLRDGLINRLLRKKDIVVRLHINNPTMSITNLSNIYVKKEPKWYQSTAFKVGVGVLLGIGISSQIK